METVPEGQFTNTSRVSPVTVLPLYNSSWAVCGVGFWRLARLGADDTELV